MYLTYLYITVVVVMWSLILMSLANPSRQESKNLVAHPWTNLFTMYWIMRFFLQLKRQTFLVQSMFFESMASCESSTVAASHLTTARRPGWVETFDMWRHSGVLFTTFLFSAFSSLFHRNLYPPCSNGWFEIIWTVLLSFCSAFLVTIGGRTYLIWWNRSLVSTWLVDPT